MWILGVTPMKIYNKEKVEQGKIFEEKRAPESGVELNSLFKEINELTSGIKGVVTSGQESSQLNFPLVKRN